MAPMNILSMTNEPMVTKERKYIMASVGCAPGERAVREPLKSRDSVGCAPGEGDGHEVSGESAGEGMAPLAR